MAIDWYSNRLAFNRDNGTNYATRKEFLSGVYKKYPTTLKSGDAIKISMTSFLRAMVQEGIPRLPKGHRFPSLAQSAILELDTTYMYRWQIAEKTGLTTSHVWILLKRFNKKWKKLKN